LASGLSVLVFSEVFIQVEKRERERELCFIVSVLHFLAVLPTFASSGSAISAFLFLLFTSSFWEHIWSLGAGFGYPGDAHIRFLCPWARFDHNTLLGRLPR